MKFSKFVKSLAPDGGAIYEYMDERWLASPSVSSPRRTAP